MLSERLQFAMRRAGLSQAELARACGVKAPSVHSWVSGKSKHIRSQNLLAAAKALGVSQTWLATGKGSYEPVTCDGCKASPEAISTEACLDKLEILVEHMNDQCRQDVGKLLDLFVRKPLPLVRQILIQTLHVSEHQNPT